MTARFVKLNKLQSYLARARVGEHALKVEEVFSSKTRMKILKILIIAGRLPVTRIARKVHASYGIVSSHLQVLEEEGVLQHRRYGRTRLYRFTMTPRAKAVQNLMETWQNQSKQTEKQISIQ